MEGFFDLVTAQDLYRKLLHDYERVLADPTDVFAAFDFAVTAWHLLDWWLPGKKNEVQRAEIRDNAPILLVCELLAVGAKHFVPEVERIKAVGDTERQSVWAEGTWAPNAWADRAWRNELVVHLDGEVARELGDRLTIVEVAKLAMKYWRDQEPLLLARAPGGELAE